MIAGHARPARGCATRHTGRPVDVKIREFNLEFILRASSIDDLSHVADTVGMRTATGGANNNNNKISRPFQLASPCDRRCGDPDRRSQQRPIKALLDAVRVTSGLGSPERSSLPTLLRLEHRFCCSSCIHGHSLGDLARPPADFLAPYAGLRLAAHMRPSPRPAPPPTTSSLMWCGGGAPLIRGAWRAENSKQHLRNSASCLTSIARCVCVCV